MEGLRPQKREIRGGGGGGQRDIQVVVWRKWRDGGRKKGYWHCNQDVTLTSFLVMGT